MKRASVLSALSVLGRASVTRTATTAHRRIVVGRGFRLRGARKIRVERGLLLGVVPFGFVDQRAGGMLRVEGALHVRGWAAVGVGAGWTISPDARVEIGDQTYFSPRTMLRSTTAITIGARCAIAWDVHIIDDDWHDLIIDGLPRPRPLPVAIGDDVWIAARVTILKGVVIPDGCVVAAASVVTGRFDEPGCLLAGSPARVVRRGIKWTSPRRDTANPMA